MVADDSHLCFYSPLMGPSGYPTYLVTASLVLARDQPKGIKPVTLLALRLLKDNIDARNKGQICVHLRARVGRHVDVTISGSSATHVPDTLAAGSVHTHALRDLCCAPPVNQCPHRVAINSEGMSSRPFH